MRTVVVAATLSVGLLSVPLTAAHAGTAWRVTIQASKTHVVAGHQVVFTGKVQPSSPAAENKVVLQSKRKPGTQWVDQKKVTVQNDGRYRVATIPATNFTHSYRVVMPATNNHPRGVSPTVKVKVYAWTKLTDLSWVHEAGMGTGTVDINAKAYTHSVYARYGSSQYAEYNVDHVCTALQATFGITDDSTTGGQAEVDVLSDGNQVYSNTFDVGQHETKTIALDSPLKLRLESQSTSAGATTGYGAFASASVLCTH